MVTFPAELRHMDPQIRILNTNYHFATPLFHCITNLLTFTQLVYNEIEECVGARYIYNLPIAQSQLLSDGCRSVSQVAEPALLTGIIN